MALPNLQDVVAARQRIHSGVRRTPLQYSPRLSLTHDCELYLKLENQQETGSFKERGALNRLLTLSAEERAKGVVAASAGNHAQGVARHAQRLGVRATIVMPQSTPLIKVERTRRYGAEVVLHGTTYDEAFQHARHLESSKGLAYVHAFDHEDIIAGQGTIGLELLEQLSELEVLICPIGGGGLISGLAMTLKTLRPHVQIIGVESESIPSMTAALNAGHPVPVQGQPTIAEGIAVGEVGQLPFEIVKSYVDRVVSVDEDEIARAILLLLEEERTVAEGAGAAALAAIISGKVPEAHQKKTVAIVCGGNIDINLMETILTRGLVRAGRRTQLRVLLGDRPGELRRMLNVLVEVQANIIEILHNRSSDRLKLGETMVSIQLDTRGPQHAREVQKKLAEQGYTLIDENEL